jgi:hypothetical protein
MLMEITARGCTLDVIHNNTELQNPPKERLSLLPVLGNISLNLYITSNTVPHDNGLRQSFQATLNGRWSFITPPKAPRFAVNNAKPNSKCARRFSPNLAILYR